MDTMQHPDEGGLGAGPARHQFRVTEHEPQSRIRRDRQALSWSRVNLNPCSAMPPQRSGAASVVVKGKLFVFGGYGGGTGRLDDFWSYSFDTATWEEVEVLSTEKPGCRENNGVVIGDGSRIFLFGGYNGTSWLNDLWMFDLDTQRWTCIQESSDPNAQPGDESSMAMGSSFSGVQHGTLVRGTVPSRRFGYVSIVHNNKFVVFGGFDGSKWLNDMYEFDFQTKTWTKIQDRGTLPSARSCPAWAKDETHVYIMGGYDGVERKADFFACDLATYTWTEMICRGTPPSPRYFHSCCLYGNKIITYGGYSGSERLSDMYFYDFETNHWSEMDCTNGDRPSGRSSLVAQVYEDNLYIMFGYNGVTVLNDFYKFRLKPVSVPPSALVSDLLRLVNNPELSDISFLVEGQEVHANRAILATRSEYFKVMLLSGGMKESGQASMTGDDSTTETDEFHSKKPPIELKDVSYPVFLKVLEFLYTDTVTKVPLEMGVPLLIMSERFMLDRLKALCEDIIRKELNTENVIGIFIASHRHNASSLKEISLEIILKNLNHPNIVLGLSDLKSEPDLLVEIIQRNSGNQTHLVETEHHGGPFGTGSEWSGTRR